MASYDLIIIGGGTSGMSTAIRAAELGLSCAVIEKSDKIGGALFWSGGHMSGGGTNLQKRKDIQDSIDDHYEDIIRINKGTGDLDLIRLACELAPKTINWLDDNGFEFAPEAPRIIFGHIPYSKPRTQYGVHKAMSIYTVLKPMWDKHVASGHITVHLNSECQSFAEHNGRYDECNIIDNSGNITSIKGGYIFMSTGGYGSNVQFFGKKHPGVPLVSSAYPTAMGEGHQLLENKYNAKFRMADYHLPSLGGIEMEKDSGRCDMNSVWAMVLTSVYRKPREIYLNVNGQRFMNEDEENPDTREREVVKQPGWNFYIVFDEAALMSKDNNGVENPIIIGWTADQIKAECKKSISFHVADTLDDISSVTGMPATNVRASVDQWNNCVDNGADPHFNRAYVEHKISEGPFYAIKVHASLLVTFGGIAVDTGMRVLDNDGQVIKGLYAAGELTGLGATSGGAFCSGMAITPAIAFGRHMAEIAAR